MGLLDDAIREHLDLKRRRGADPAEIERAEREALGPVRRGPDAPPADVAVDEALAYDHEDEPEWAEPYDETAEPAVEPAPPQAPERSMPPRYSEEYEPEPEEHDPFAGEEPLFGEPAESVEEQPRRRRFLRRSQKQEPSPAEEHDELAEEHYDDHGEFEDHYPEPPAEEHPAPHRAAAEPPQPPPEHLSSETVEYKIEDALPEKHGEADEDVLEETPEFLQDTPDHDRLWFEQRPPRDFDFDE